MKKITLLRGEKIIEAIEVTKKDVLELQKDGIRISMNDKIIETLENVNDDEIIGSLLGDIDIINGYANKNNDYDIWIIDTLFMHNNYKVINESNNLSFGEALVLLKNGHKVTRSGWNGKDMFIFLVKGSKFKVSRPPLLGIYENGTEIEYQPHIDIKTANGSIVPWLASQTDILSSDWCLAN